MRPRPFRWIKRALSKNSEPGLAPLDNAYRRMRFGQGAAGGLDGALQRRLGNFENPTPLDKEEL